LIVLVLTTLNYLQEVSISEMQEYQTRDVNSFFVCVLLKKTIGK